MTFCTAKAVQTVIMGCAVLLLHTTTTAADDFAQQTPVQPVRRCSISSAIVPTSHKHDRTVCTLNLVQDTVVDNVVQLHPRSSRQAGERPRRQLRNIQLAGSSSKAQ
eukprot:GHRR01004791.1.p2 GENE.GHRR01004791.1~~GHRR01004791.1.p2  ORF type:complete len:107 (-),score=5.09 GHRR01004791.1:475-795(-)